MSEASIEMDQFFREELTAERHRNDGDNYHSPIDLSLDGAGLKKALIIGSCNSEGWGFHSSNSSNTPVDFVLTNNVAQLTDQTNEVLSQYGLQVIQLAFRSIFHDASIWRLDYADVQGHARVFDECVKRLRLFLRQYMKYNLQNGLLTLVANFFVPQSNPMGRLFPKFDLRNPEYFVMRLNQELEISVAEYRNSYILDIDRLSAIFGKKYIQDDSVSWIAHGSLLGGPGWDRSRIEHTPPFNLHYTCRSNEFKAALWEEIVASYKTTQQRDQVKLVVVDLDDTLWKGVVGEMDAPGPSIVEGWPLGVAEALMFLKRRGVMLAIISKNDETRIREIFTAVFKNRLVLEDFSVVKINYQPKVQNLAEILSVVNVLPNSVVYLDDNPVERASLKAAFPDLRVLSRYHYYWRRTLMWSAETQVATVTNESARRTEMMRAQVHREELKQEMSREDFLKSLELKVHFFDVSSVDHPSYSRIFELVNKTNQFNTTGVRWTSEDFQSLLLKGGGDFRCGSF